MSARVVCVIAWFAAVAACDSKTNREPGGGGNGGPTPPGPVATTGTISGRVTATGVGVSDARILLGQATFATTAASGQYTFAEVPPGTHSITLVTPRQFALTPGEVSVKSTTVTVGQTSTVNWTLMAAPPPGPITVVWVVDLEATQFMPSDLTISRGHGVLWVNKRPIFHTISPDDRNQPGAWRTQNIAARVGESFSHNFNTPGTFHYSCTIHLGMTGVVRVR